MKRVDRLERVRMVSNGSPTQTTARLFAALAEGLERQGHQVEFIMRQLPRGIWPKLRSLPKAEAENARCLRRNDVFIVHTPLALSVISVAVARILGRPVIAFVWDLHPESTRIVGSLRNPVLLGIYWLLERLVLSLATSIVIPSSDYAAAVERWRRKTRVIPLWPCDAIGPPRDDGPRADHDLRIGFAGQINGIRGLSSGVDGLLDAWKGSSIELHVFSKDPCPTDLLTLAQRSERLKLVEHGELSPKDLQEELRTLDAGWVSLDPDFRLPAFPSKAMAYVCAGIPVMFNGPPLPGYRRWLSESGFGICLDERPVTPSDLRTLGEAFPRARREYLQSMEKEWFGLEALL